MIQDNTNQDELAEKATAAFKETVQLVVGQARQTHTPIIVWHEGAVVSISVGDFEDSPPTLPPDKH